MKLKYVAFSRGFNTNKNFQFIYLVVFENIINITRYKYTKLLYSNINIYLDTTKSNP